MRPAWLLANQLANPVLVLIPVAGPIAAMDVADVALAIDDDGTRHFIDVIRLAHLVCRVEEDGETDRLAREQFLHGGRFLVDIDAAQGKAPRPELLLHPFPQRHFLLPTPPPTPPHI